MECILTSYIPATLHWTVSILSIFISTCSQVCIIVVCLGLWLMCIMICYVVREPEEGRRIA